MKNGVGRNDPCPCGSGRNYESCCLNRSTSQQERPALWPPFRFEPGSYGAPGRFMPSLACLRQVKPDQWDYHFILVRPDMRLAKESDAVSQATKDLNFAFDHGPPTVANRVAESLKSLGYLSVEGFKVVEDEGPPHD